VTVHAGCPTKQQELTQLRRVRIQLGKAGASLGKLGAMGSLVHLARCNEEIVARIRELEEK